MARIKIINGTYGYMKGSVVEPKTPRDGYFEVSDEEAEWLVSKGVAAYEAPGSDIVEPEEPEAETELPEAEAEATVEEVEPEEPEAEKPLKEMSFEELKASALALGIDIHPLKSKAALIEAIEARKEELSVGEVPSFDAESPVVE